MISFDNNFLGFTNKNHKNNSYLYVIKDLNELTKNNFLTKDQQNLFAKVFLNNSNCKFTFLPNIDSEKLTAVSIINPSKTFRQSTIDQSFIR